MSQVQELFFRKLQGNRGRFFYLPQRAWGHYQDRTWTDVYFSGIHDFDPFWAKIPWLQELLEIESGQIGLFPPDLTSFKDWLGLEGSFPLNQGRGFLQLPNPPGTGVPVGQVVDVVSTSVRIGRIEDAVWEESMIGRLIAQRRLLDFDHILQIAARMKTAISEESVKNPLFVLRLEEAFESL